MASPKRKRYSVEIDPNRQEQQALTILLGGLLDNLRLTSWTLRNLHTSSEWWRDTGTLLASVLHRTEARLVSLSSRDRLDTKPMRRRRKNCLLYSPTCLPNCTDWSCEKLHTPGGPLIVSVGEEEIPF